MAGIEEKSISAQDSRRVMGWAVLLQLGSMFVFLLPDLVISPERSSLFGLDIKTYKNLLTIFEAMGMEVLIVFALKRLKDLTWVESLQYLGFKKPNQRQIIIGILSCLPVVFCCIYNYQTGAASFTVISWTEIVSLFILPGLHEETFYRGFLFRLFRENRPFFPAAILAGIFWSSSHLVNYAFVFRLYPHRLAFQLTCVLLLSIPAAYLFERGGNVIWGWMIFHIGYDYFFETFPVNPPFAEDGFFTGWQIQIFAVIILTCLVTWGLTAWLLPATLKKLEVKNQTS